MENYLIFLLLLILVIPEIEEDESFQEVSCSEHRWETNDKGLLACSICKRGFYDE